MSGLIKILVVGNHPIVRGGLTSLLVARNGMQVVGEAVNGEQAIGKALHLQPDVILMDMIAPRMSTGTAVGKGAIEAIRNICTDNPSAAIVVITGFHDEGQIAEVVEAGALGCLRLDTSLDELFQAIRNAANRDTYLPQEITDLLLIGEARVRGHVSGLLGKLGVNKRTQATLKSALKATRFNFLTQRRVAVP